MKKLWALALPALLSPSAHAGSKLAEARKSVEASMKLSGDIVVGSDGRVLEYKIDKAEKVDAPMIAFAGRQIHAWKFEPQQADGKPVQVKNKMYLSLRLKKLDDDNYELSFVGAYFRPWLDEDAEKTEKLDIEAKSRRDSGRRMDPPRYPMDMVRMGASGTAYLLVKVGAEGKVEDVVAEQVNLRFISQPKTMELARRKFADAAISAAKQWVLVPPTEGESYHVVRVPVDYCLVGDAGACGPGGYGKWRAYVAGPVQVNPWSKEKDAIGFSPDALPDTGVFPVGEKGGLKLVTPLQGGA